jgi:hypothetical protein
MIRHRLRDEADRCCDAWVTSLLPASAQRGAYARALLTTRQFLGNSRLDTPAMGLGVTSAQARQFARRLTMVMTERSNPGMSMMGAVLTVCVAAGALLSAPLLACPPDEPPSAAKSPRASVNRAPRAVIAIPTRPTPPTAPSPPMPPVPPAPPAPPMGDDASTFERHMRERGQPSSFAPGALGEDGEMRMRLEMLEQRLNRLSEHLESLLGGQGRGGQSEGPRGMRSAPLTRVAPSVSGQPGAMVWSGQAGATAPRAGGNVFVGPAEEGESVTMFYALSGGKLEALTELMSRSDVPVLITPMDSGIQVHGTPRQQEVFAAFVNMINPQGKPPAGGGANAAERLQEELAAVRAASRTRLDQAREVSRKAIRERQSVIETQRSKMLKKAQELYRRAREVEGRADALHDQADDKEGHEQNVLLAQADALYSEATALESAAEQIEDQADALEDELDKMVSQAEDLDEEIEQSIEDALAALEMQAAVASSARSDEVEAALAAEMAMIEAEAAAVAAESEVDEDEDDDDCR